MAILPYPCTNSLGWSAVFGSLSCSSLWRSPSTPRVNPEVAPSGRWGHWPEASPPPPGHTLGPAPPDAPLVGHWGARMPWQHTSVSAPLWLWNLPHSSQSLSCIQPNTMPPLTRWWWYRHCAIYLTPSTIPCRLLWNVCEYPWWDLSTVGRQSRNCVDVVLTERPPNPTPAQT